RTGKPAAREPLKQAVVARLRQRYPDLSDLTDDELVSSFHEEMLDQEMKRPIKERALGPESGPDDLLKILGRQGIVVKKDERVPVQMNVPVLNTEAPLSTKAKQLLVAQHCPALS